MGTKNTGSKWNGRLLEENNYKLLISRGQEGGWGGIVILGVSVSSSWRDKSKGLFLTSVFSIEVLNISLDGLPSLNKVCRDRNQSFRHTDLFPGSYTWPQKLRVLCYSSLPMQIKDAVTCKWWVVPFLERASLQGKVCPICKDRCCSLRLGGAAVCSCVTWPSWLVEEGSCGFVL